MRKSAKKVIVNGPKVSTYDP